MTTFSQMFFFVLWQRHRQISLLLGSPVLPLLKCSIILFSTSDVCVGGTSTLVHFVDWTASTSSLKLRRDEVKAVQQERT